ncbi:MAG TPA: alkaline phosphatase family protein, partial [Thermoplasmata archaeon]|nr:alkaline phosphatase family protein [Thermoplasmata archaeon]
LTLSGELPARAGPPPLPQAIQDPLSQFSSHIDHIVFVMLENHPFDNYFGTYCTKTSRICPNAVNGLPNGTCIPFNTSNLSRGCIRPYPFTPKNWTLPNDLRHSQNSSLRAWDHGKMDGFWNAEGKSRVPYGYYAASTIPLYWDLAEQYGLGDSFFSTAQSYSLPNHWDSLAGVSPPEVVNYTLFNGTTGGTPPAFVRSVYLHQAANTSTVEDLLKAHNATSWTYYDYALGNFTKASNTSKNGVGGLNNSFDYWNPLGAKAESYVAPLRNHFVPNTQFFSDAQNGTLPSLSWVIPFAAESDHPQHNTTRAEAWLANVVDAVESGPEWNTTALFITWDDYGGFYDHVAPPRLAHTQLSFRVPVIVISPYTPRGKVVAQNLSFYSILALMEKRFGLGCLQPTDCSTPLPLRFFNFSLAPRAPILFPTNVSAWIYPMAPQEPNAAYAPLSFVAASAFTNDPGGNGPDAD